MAISSEFIAETDEFGRVICVWKTDPETRVPRPFDPASDEFDPETATNFSGAASTAIAAWVTQAVIRSRSFLGG